MSVIRGEITKRAEFSEDVLSFKDKYCDSQFEGNFWRVTLAMDDFLMKNTKCTSRGRVKFFEAVHDKFLESDDRDPSFDDLLKLMEKILTEDRFISELKI